jgi:hypothetical protein
MPALDLALGHRVVGHTVDVTHILTIEPFGKIG